MKLKFSFSPLRFIFLFSLLVFMTVQVFAQTLDPQPTPGIWGWVQDHWTLIALIISESLPFMPVKISGIFEGVLAFMASFLKKK